MPETKGPIGQLSRLVPKISQRLGIKWNFELTMFELTVPDLYIASNVLEILASHKVLKYT